MSRPAVITLLALLFLVSAGFAQVPARAVPPTITLTVAPQAVSVTPGSLITLTATVTAQGSPVQHGVVLFCEATATDCRDSALLGKAQLTANGTAILLLKLGAGNYAIKAMFQGTPGSQQPLAGASSEAKTLNVSFPSAQ